MEGAAKPERPMCDCGTRLAYWCPSCELLVTRSKPWIYVASKTRHAWIWKELRAAGHMIVASWIDEAGHGQTLDWADLWRRCVREVAFADVCVVYREDSELLKGALIEMGVALAKDKRVFFVGNPGGIDAVNHPSVTVFDSVEKAFVEIYKEVP